MVPSRDDLCHCRRRRARCETGCVNEQIDVTKQIDPDTIVVAVDGSEHADRALRWAAEQASLERRRLVVFTADHDRSVAEAGAVEARRLHPDLTVDHLAVDGDPRRVLLGLSSHARLLVIGSRGRGTLKSMLLGSVSAVVSAQALCPVVVCRPVTAKHTVRGVTVGADGTAESLPVIEFAFQQASLRGLPLSLVHCFWDAATAAAELSPDPARVLDESDHEDLRAVLSESVAGFREQFPDVQVSLNLKHGLVDKALSPRGEACDLIVVGRHPKTSVDRVVSGALATAVVERASSTVAVVPEAAES